MVAESIQGDGALTGTRNTARTQPGKPDTHRLTEGMPGMPEGMPDTHRLTEGIQTPTNLSEIQTPTNSSGDSNAHKLVECAVLPEDSDAHKLVECAVYQRIDPRSREAVRVERFVLSRLRRAVSCARRGQTLRARA